MVRILFICHGNICRSPMAEFMMKDMVKKKGMERDFYIASAATSSEEVWDGIGSPVYPPAREELSRHGISCEGKRAVQLVRDDYGRYDYLIGMDAANIRNILRMTGGKMLEDGGKVALLLDFAGVHRSISDPWYTGDFRSTYRDIVQGLDGFFAWLGEQGLLPEGGR